MAAIARVLQQNGFAGFGAPQRHGSRGNSRPCRARYSAISRSALRIRPSAYLARNCCQRETLLVLCSARSASAEANKTDMVMVISREPINLPRCTGEYRGGSFVDVMGITKMRFLVQSSKEV